MKSVVNSNILMLGLLLGLSAVIISVTNHYILTINFFDSSGEYLNGNPALEGKTYEDIQKYIYSSTVIYTTFKLFVVALVLYTALFLADHPIPFAKAFNIVILSEFIFLLSAVLKIIWFLYAYPNGTLSDWHKTYIFSVLSLTGRVSADWYYPLQTLNLFEMLYWFILAYGIFCNTSLTYDRSLRIVVFSYLPALFIWVATIVFCTVMIFPGNA